MDPDDITAQEFAALMQGEFADDAKGSRLEQHASEASSDRGLDQYLREHTGCGENLGELPVSSEIRFTLQSIMEEYCGRLTQEFHGPLRGDVDVRCSRIHADTFAAFVLGIDHPTCFQVVSIPPCDGRLLIEMPPAILFPWVEALLGGGRYPGTLSRRALTGMEHRVVGWLTGLVLEAFTASWSTLVTLRPAVDRVESNPRVVRCLRASEPLLVVATQWRLASAQGTIRFAMPLVQAIRACLQEFRDDGARSAAS